METSATRHPFAVDHLPSFITAPGQTDVLFNFVVAFMVVAIFAAGVLYMRLHALPEHLAHRTQKVQFEIVAVLGIIALFTHNRIFWIAALLLAMIDLPNFLSPLQSMAASLGKMASGLKTGPAQTDESAKSDVDEPESFDESAQAEIPQKIDPPENRPAEEKIVASREEAN